jgi:hypothetical protein
VKIGSVRLLHSIFLHVIVQSLWPLRFQWFADPRF